MKLKTKKMSTSAIFVWKHQYPDLFEQMTSVEICSNTRTRLYSKVAQAQAKANGVSEHNRVYGSDLGKIFDWLDYTCEKPYYVEGDQSSNKYIFKFVDKNDAAIFKLGVFDESRA